MSDPFFSSTVRTRADGADERIHSKIVGTSTTTAGDAAVFQAKVEADGLHVVVDDVLSSTDEIISQYGETLAIASGVETTIGTYTVPIGKTFYLNLVEASGDNVAIYNIYKNGILIAKRRTYFGGDLNTDFLFGNSVIRGLGFIAGDIIDVKTIHQRPFVGDFDSRIFGILRG